MHQDVVLCLEHEHEVEGSANTQRHAIGERTLAYGVDQEYCGCCRYRCAVANLSEEKISDFNGEKILKDMYRITVADNGIGFDEKYVDKIFTVFQKLHSRNAYEGTGVGLAICRKIVERHNGEITATSTRGKGSTFIVTIPAKQKQRGFVP